MKNISKKILGVSLVLILLFMTNASLAVTQSEINSQKNKQTQINSQIKDVEEKKEEVEAKKSETMKQVQKIGSEIAGYQEQIDKLDDQITEANNKIAEAEQQLKENQTEHDKKEKKLKERLVAVYESGETSYLDFLLSSSSLTDFISNYYLVSEITDMDSQLLEELEREKVKITNAKQQIESSKRELESSKAEKEKVTTQLKSAKAEKDKYVAQLSAEEAELEKKIQELKQANARIAAEIKEAERKYAQQLEALKNKNNSSGNYSGNISGNGFLSRPVASGSITAQSHYSSGKFHGAIDYGVPCETTVYAAADGVVMSTANLSGSYGTYIVIRHVNGLQTYYAHGTYGSIKVSPGQIVSKGQPIMLSGNTGNSSGPHLHFEVRVSPYSYNGYATNYGQDSRVNPLAYM